MQVLIRAGVCDTDEALAAFAKSAAGDADDLLLVEQAVAELDAAQAEAADVGKDVERAVRAVAADAVDLGEAVEQDAAARVSSMTKIFSPASVWAAGRPFGILIGMVSSSAAQRLIEICDQVFRLFQSARKAHQLFADARRGQLLRAAAAPSPARPSSAF